MIDVTVFGLDGRAMKLAVDEEGSVYLSEDGVTSDCAGWVRQKGGGNLMTMQYGCRFIMVSGWK